MTTILEEAELRGSFPNPVPESIQNAELRGTIDPAPATHAPTPEASVGPSLQLPPPVLTNVPQHLAGYASVAGWSGRSSGHTVNWAPTPMVRPRVGSYQSRLRITRDVPSQPEQVYQPTDGALTQQGVGQDLTSWAQAFLDGESRGNFNAWFGNANNKEDIQSLTLKEILRRQDQPGNDAAGILQIVPSTLRHVMQRYGYNPNDTFDAVTQLEMTLILLEEKGLSRYLEGSKSLTSMANDVASVWAAFQTSAGRGVYDGDGVNKALVSHENVKQNLEVLKGVVEQHGLQELVQQGITAGSLRRFMRQHPGPSQRTMSVYGNIPDVDEDGRSGQIDKFIEWNPDPIGNHEANLNSIEPQLAEVVRLATAKAQEEGDFTFVVGSGRRNSEQQQRAVDWGWSKTTDSAHLRGEAVDLWPIVDGKVIFDEPKQRQIVQWMKEAAQELGVSLEAGADWQSFPDLPDFRLR